MRSAVHPGDRWLVRDRVPIEWIIFGVAVLIILAAMLK